MDMVKFFVDELIAVTNSLTLIAFISTLLFACLIVVLKQTNGLEIAQKLLLPGGGISPGDFVSIVNRVLYITLAVAAMLFVFLAYTFHLEITTPVKIQEMKTGPICYEDSCIERDPKDNDCDTGVANITSTIASFPSLGDEFNNISLEMRHSDRCNARWVRSSAKPGMTMYLENTRGEQLVPFTIPVGSNYGEHYTDMYSGAIKSRACVRASNGESQCTGWVAGT